MQRRKTPLAESIRNTSLETIVKEQGLDQALTEGSNRKLKGDVQDFKKSFIPGQATYGTLTILYKEGKQFGYILTQDTKIIHTNQEFIFQRDWEIKPEGITLINIEL